MIVGTKIYLRTVDFYDSEYVLNVENNEAFWELSETNTPFSMNDILLNIKELQQDFTLALQSRFMIKSLNTKKTIGIIDLFNYKEEDNEVSVGIIIPLKADRKKGFAQEALALIEEFIVQNYSIQILKCTIFDKNKSSISLFTKNGFQKYKTIQAVNLYSKKLKTIHHYKKIIL